MLRSVELQNVVGVSGEVAEKEKKKVLKAVYASIPIGFSSMGDFRSVYVISLSSSIMKNGQGTCSDIHLNQV